MPSSIQDGPKKPWVEHCRVCQSRFDPSDVIRYDPALSGPRHTFCKAGGSKLPDPIAKYRDAKGRMMKGHPDISGRGAKVEDGITSLKRLIREHAAEMSIEGGEFDKFFREMRARGDKGVLWMLRNLFDPFLRAQAATIVNPTQINVTVKTAKPPPKKVANANTQGKQEPLPQELETD